MREFAKELVKLIGKEGDAVRRGVYEAYLMRVTEADMVTPRAAQSGLVIEASAEHTEVGF